MESFIIFSNHPLSFRWIGLGILFSLLFVAFALKSSSPLFLSAKIDGIESNLVVWI